jgi:hypothetical protein
MVPKGEGGHAKHGKKNTMVARLRSSGSYMRFPGSSPPIDLFNGGAEFSW